MNKYSEQKLNERNKNTARETKRIGTTFDVDNCLFHDIG